MTVQIDIDSTPPVGRVHLIDRRGGAARPRGALAHAAHCAHAVHYAYIAWLWSICHAWGFVEYARERYSGLVNHGKKLAGALEQGKDTLTFVNTMMNDIALISAGVAAVGLLIAYMLYQQVNKVKIDNEKVADITDEIFKEAQAVAKLIAEKLDYIGTMCVEYFIDQNNTLLVNEIAPRVHNSGHLTINAFNISQFENHVRAVCSLEKIPLKKISNAKMVNLIGNQIKPYRENFKLNENEFFFDYQKKEIKDKRKMGHITTLI